LGSASFYDAFLLFRSSLNTDLPTEVIQRVSESQIIVGKEEYKSVSALMDSYILAISQQSTKVVTDSTAIKSKD